MINKQVETATSAVEGIYDGAVVMVGGFGESGSPTELIHALIDQGAKDLVIVNNNTGSGHVGLAALIENKQVAKMICSFPRTANSPVFAEMYKRNEIDLELVPQGTLAERIRAGGAGVPAFYTATSVGTPLAEGKECRTFGNKDYVLEHSINADFALIKGLKSDRYGNLIYYKTARNFNPIMAMAANVTISQVKEYCDAGDIDPEIIVTPGLFIDRVVVVENPVLESDLINAGVSYP